MHPYFLDHEARSRWDDLHRLATAARPPVPLALRVRVGEAIVHLGRRIAGTYPPPLPACTWSTSQLS